MTMKRSPVSDRFTRRTFLGALGMGAMASGASGLLAPNAALAQRRRPLRFVIRDDRFGRMFPDLDPFFRENTPRLQAALKDIGKLGGRLDAKDDLGTAPVERNGEQAAINLIANPALSANNPNNPNHTAGTTFIGQFIDHDLTFDLTSRLAVVAEPTAIPQRARPPIRPRLRLWRRAASGS